MHRKLRVAVLLFILVSDAHAMWIARGRSADWKYSVRVAIYPIAGDNSAVSTAYIQQLRVDTIPPIAAVIKAEARRHGLALDAPVDMYLSPPLAVTPPLPPVDGNVAEIMLWSLHLRFWTWCHDNMAGRIPLSLSEAEIAPSLAQCVISPATAREINRLGK